jgi:hypothetical protein
MLRLLPGSLVFLSSGNRVGLISMRKLDPSEAVLVGKWVSTSQGVHSDEIARRIDWLTQSILERVAESPTFGAWETLYCDPADGRLWERTYPESASHGGGPPQLTVISLEQALEKYGERVRAATTCRA